MSTFDFSFTSPDELIGKEGGSMPKFGLNTGHVTGFAYNPNAGKDGAMMNAVEIQFTATGCRPTTLRIFPPEKVFGRNGEIFEGDPEYEARRATAVKQATGTVYHVAMALGVSEQDIQRMLASKPTGFADWATAIAALLPKDYPTRTVDFFMEYEWSIRNGQDRTWPTVPRNLKGGAFCVPHVPPFGEWKEQREWTVEDKGIRTTVKGLRYVDGKGNVHPFARGQSFMESNKGKVQGNVQQNGAKAGAMPEDAPW